MPVEWIIVLLIAAVAAVGFAILFARRGKGKNPPKTENKQNVISDVPLVQNTTPDNTVALSEIESLILTSADGQELVLTRPDAVRLAEKKHREVSARGSAALGQIAQGAMPVLAQAQTLNQIAKAAPNGLFTATGSVQDLMKYADGTVGSIVMGDKGKAVE